MQPADDDDVFATRLAAWEDERAAGDSADPAELDETPRFLAACSLVQRLESLWEPTQPSAEALVGLERFRIVRILGTGGFGIVYLAHDGRLNRQVALKVPRLEALTAPDWRERFRREAHAVAQLDHPNIVPLFDSGEVGSWCFLVSAYCSEGSLADWLRTQETPLPFPTAARLVATLAQAVQHAHERGILHRDLKPSNILLTKTPKTSVPWEGFPFVPHIADFGLAKVSQPTEDPDAFATVTRSTVFLGTPAYMAPEQTGGSSAAVGTSADVYALGVLLYELLAGQPPFHGATHLETLHQVVNQEPAPPGQHRAKTPRDLEAICLKCLEKAPGRRYASAADLAEDLARFLDHRPTQARPLGLLQRVAKDVRRHPALATLSTLALVGVAVVIGGLLWRSRELEGHTEDLKAAADRESALALKARTAQTLAEQRERRVRLQTYATNLNLADTFIKEKRRSLADELLARQIPVRGAIDDRDFAWHYLWHNEKTMVRGRKSVAMVLAFAADGKQLYVGDDHATLQCFDVAHRKEIRASKLAPDLHYPLRWQFSPTGEHVSVVSAIDKQTRMAIFESASLRQLYRTALDTETIPSSSFSPDGARWAVCDHDPLGKFRVSLVDVKTGLKTTLPGKAGYRPLVVACAPDGGALAIVFEAFPTPLQPACVFALYSFKTDKMLEVASPNGFRDTGAIRWSPDGKWLACASYSQNVVVWSTAPLRRHLALPLKTFSPADLAFSRDGKHLAVVDSSATPESQMVRTFRVADGQENPATLSTRAPVHAIAWSPVEDVLALAGTDNDIQLWNPLPAPPQRMLAGHRPAEAWYVAFAADGKTLASTGDDWMLRLWDPHTGQPLDAKAGHTSLVPSVTYSPDGRWLATGSYDKQIILRSATKPYDEVRRLQHTQRIFRVAFSPDSKLLASCGRDTGDVAIRLWHADTGTAAGLLAGHKNLVRSLAFAPRENILASASTDKTVCLWDPLSQKLLHTLAHNDQVHALAFSPDGRKLVTGELSGAITFWNVADGRAITTLQHHTGCVRALAYAPDGRTLASGSQDRTVRLWNPEVHQELFAFPVLSHEVNSVAFSPDSEYLAAGLHDGQIALWHGPRPRRD